MIYISVLVFSVSITFLAHHFFERKLTKAWTKNFDFVIGKWHIHHSFFGATSLVVASFISAPMIAIILAGYGIGNIWQHKYTHNLQGEKGMVFITKANKE